MKIVERIESRERCAESGWFAYDYLLEEQIDRDFIRSLKPLGAWVFLDMLAKPFFKIESEHFMIKGLLGETYFRMAVHHEHEEELHRLEKFIEII